MRYPANVYLNLAFLFFGAFWGCGACVVAGKVSRRKYFKFRISLAFLLLAIAAVFFAMFFLEARFQSYCADFILEKIMRPFPSLAYMAAGAICTAFLRSIFPVVLAVYILFTFCFGIALYKRLPRPQKLTLTVNKNFLRDETNGKEYEFFSEENFFETNAQRVVAFFVYELNENVVLPLPHFWYEIAGAALQDSSGSVRQISNVDFSARDIFLPNVSDNFFKRILFGIYRTILNDARLEIFALPDDQIFPALYNVDIQGDGADFRATFKKIM